MLKKSITTVTCVIKTRVKGIMEASDKGIDFVKISECQTRNYF